MKMTIYVIFSIEMLKNAVTIILSYSIKKVNCFQKIYSRLSDLFTILTICNLCDIIIVIIYYILLKRIKVFMYFALIIRNG